jgi:dihydropyrimidinase
MAEFEVVVRNGTVVTASDIMQCDIGIRGGQIVALGANLAQGAREVDASGKIVTPGGVEGHCHLAQMTASGIRSADGFESGSISAAFGGTTTIIPFACQDKGQPSMRKVVDDYHKEADGNSIIDYAFHLIISEPNANMFGQELPSLVREGYTSIKIYMTYASRKISDWEVLDVLDFARREGAMIMVHAENDDTINWLTDKLVQAGKTGPKYQPHAHTTIVEREATHRAIALAETVDVPILIVHVSGGDAVEQIDWARRRGLKIYAETCPQYLFLTADDFDRHHCEGAKFMCTPPPRDKANQEVIWRNLATGLFAVFSSDHAPYRFDETGKLFNGPSPVFNKIPYGIPGIELRMPLLFSEGVGKGRIDINQFVALTATNAAKLYGLYPRKGTIAIGSDADLALWDADREVDVTASMLHDNAGYTPYEGMKLKGWPVTVISRGDVICDEGKLTAKPGRGQFLKCASPDPARPSQFRRATTEAHVSNAAVG